MTSVTTCIRDGAILIWGDIVTLVAATTCVVLRGKAVGRTAGGKTPGVIIGDNTTGENTTNDDKPSMN